MSERNYDVNRMATGQCSNCRMKGFVQWKAMIRPNDLNALTGDTSDSVPTLLVCLTCFETPAGMKSANLDHERLPEEEYLKK